MSNYRDSKGRFKAGNPGGGRKPRKVPVEIQNKLHELAEQLIADITTSQDSLSMSQKLEILPKILPFVVPRLNAIEGSFGVTLDQLMGMTKEERMQVLREYQQQDENKD